MALLARIRDELADLIVVEQFPKLEGRQMVMMIAPGRKKPSGGGGGGSAPKPVAEVIAPAAVVVEKAEKAEKAEKV